MIKIEEIKNVGLIATIDSKDLNNAILEMVTLTCGFMNQLPKDYKEVAAGLLEQAILQPNETLSVCKIMQNVIQQTDNLIKDFKEQFTNG